MSELSCRAVRGSLVAVVGFVVWWGVGVTAASAATTETATFTVPGSYVFNVPTGVTSITVTATGGAGGSVGVLAGGRGAAVTATVPVVSDEQLLVGVGGSVAGGSSTGGIGGGGSSDANTLFPGAGGGGASSVGASSFPASGLLVVAAGGGGAAGATAGGDAGSPGGGAGGGGAGTSSGGGAGGSESGASPGAPGSFGFGGHGGTPGGETGGGGGGGYYGGGGGDGLGGGGGGGSSFVAQAATDVTGPTPTAASPSVSITYLAPTASESSSTLSFGTEPQGVAGPVQVLAVTNNGAAPLVVSDVLLSGTDAADYLIDDNCQEPVAPGASCQIGVRFAPQATGPSSATLTLQTNSVTAPGPVALSGIGGLLPQGPAGPTGPAGANGQVELVTCRAVTKTVTRKIHGERKRVKVTQNVCTTKLVSRPVKFTTGGAPSRAVLTRAGVRVHGVMVGAKLLFAEPIKLASGRYTLVRTQGSRVTKETVIIR
jgi:hypothetical protein